MKRTFLLVVFLLTNKIHSLALWSEVAAYENPKYGALVTFSTAPNVLRSISDPSAKKRLSCNTVDTTRELWRAAVNGDFKKLRTLIENDRSLLTTPIGRSRIFVLGWASSSGHSTLVRYLLDKKAPIDALDSKGSPTIQWAAFRGHYDVVELLIDRGANVNIQAYDKSAALHWAVEHPKIIRLLVEKGKANVRLKDYSGQTALHAAARHGKAESVTYLIECGLNVNIRDPKNETPLFGAAREKNLATCKALLAAGAKSNAVNNKGETPLNMAAFAGDEAIVRLLLSAGASVDHTDAAGKTALHWAAGHPQVVEILLTGGAKAIITDKKSGDALSWAAHMGDKNSVEQLLKQSRPKVSHTSIENAARLAVMGNHKEIVECLLLYARKHYKKKKISLLLSWAATKGHLGLIDLVLEHSSLNETDEHERTPLIHALMHGHFDFAEELINRHADVTKSCDQKQTALAWASFHGNRRLVKLLLDKGAKAQTRDHMGRSPLSWAAGEGHLEIVKDLLKYPVDIDNRDDKGRTPLTWAILKNKLNVAKYLIKQGANVANLDTKGESLLTAAASTGSVAMLELIVPHATPEMLADENQKTALMCAVIQGYVIIVQKLLAMDSYPINNQDIPKKRTAIMWAIRMCRGTPKKNLDQNPISLVSQILVELINVGAKTDIPAGSFDNAHQAIKSLCIAEEQKLLLLDALEYPKFSNEQRQEFTQRQQTLALEEFQNAKAHKSQRDMALLKKAFENNLSE